MKYLTKYAHKFGSGGHVNPHLLGRHLFSECFKIAKKDGDSASVGIYRATQRYFSAAAVPGLITLSQVAYHLLDYPTQFLTRDVAKISATASYHKLRKAHEVRCTAFAALLPLPRAVAA